MCGSVVTEGKDDKMASKYLVKTRSWLMTTVDVSRQQVFYEKKKYLLLIFFKPMDKDMSEREETQGNHFKKRN